jgi:hypothetical protein
MSQWKLKHVSVGARGGIWGAGAIDGTLLRLYGDTGLAGWNAARLGHADIVAAIDGGEAWCVNRQHEIWHAVDAHQPNGGHWSRVSTHSGMADAQTISVGVLDGTVWYAQSDGQLFRRQGGAWHVDPTGRAIVIAAVSRTHLWCIDPGNDIWHLEAGAWSRVATHSGASDAVSISVGMDGSVWYVDVGGALHWRDGNGWQVDPLVKATVVAAVSKDDVWCLNEAGETWHKFAGKWSKDIEVNSNELTWSYTVKHHEHLLGIVRREFKLSDKFDTMELDRILGLLVAQNPHITRDTIRPNDILRLRY